MTQLSDLGVLGLAVMGANLARNAARKGFGVAVYNRNGARTDELIKEHGSEGEFHASKTIADFVAAMQAGGCTLLALHEYGDQAEAWENPPLTGLPQALLLVGKKLYSAGETGGVATRDGRGDALRWARG